MVCAPILTYLCWEIYYENIQNFMDKYSWALQVLFTVATVGNTLLLTMDRYIAIVHPFKYSGCWLTRHWSLYATVVTVWMICISWAMLPFILESLGCQRLPRYYVWYNYTILYGFYGIPLVLILIMNLTMVHTILTLDPATSGQSEQSLKWGSTIAIVSFILTVSYVPNMIWLQIELLNDNENYILLSMTANTITVFNSCANPVTYALRTTAFKRAILRLFKSGDKPSPFNASGGRHPIVN